MKTALVFLGIVIAGVIAENNPLYLSPVLVPPIRESTPFRENIPLIERPIATEYHPITLGEAPAPVSAPVIPYPVQPTYGIPQEYGVPHHPIQEVPHQTYGAPHIVPHRTYGVPEYIHRQEQPLITPSHRYGAPIFPSQNLGYPVKKLLYDSYGVPIKPQEIPQQTYGLPQYSEYRYNQPRAAAPFPVYGPPTKTGYH